jgi:hypothetical protein
MVRAVHLHVDAVPDGAGETLLQGWRVEGAPVLQRCASLALKRAAWRSGSGLASGAGPQRVADGTLIALATESHPRGSNSPIDGWGMIEEISESAVGVARDSGVEEEEEE